MQVQPTLNSYLQRPFSIKRNLQDAKMGDVIRRIKEFRDDSHIVDKTTPDCDAIEFYFLNHLVSEARFDIRHKDQPLGKYAHIFQRYYDTSEIMAARAFYYLLLICTREARHNNKDITFYTFMEPKFTKPVSDFLYDIRSGHYGSDGTANYFQTIPADLNVANLGDYTKALRHVFYKGSYSGGYGGSAWGKVADCLNDFAHGVLSAEMMLDTVWTLCHNNGPIFNKGMLYHGYSGHLKTILDVQRAGMIPHLIHDRIAGLDYISLDYVPQSLRDYYTDNIDLFPRLEGAYVDWYMVESLGAIQTYTSYKHTQTAKYGLPESIKKAEELKKKAEELAAKKAKELAEYEAKTFYKIGQDKYKKLTREEVQNG